MTNPTPNSGKELREEIRRILDLRGVIELDSQSYVILEEALANLIDRERRKAVEDFFPRWQKEAWENMELTTAEECRDKVIAEMFPSQQ